MNRLRKSELNYEIEVLGFKQLYDLNGDRTLMKQIITHGEGVLKPSEGNQVIFELSIYLGSEMILTKSYQIYLNSENLNEGEIIIVKSLKKKEKSRIMVSKEYIKSSLLMNNETIDKIYNSDLRITYEIELIKFKQNLSIINSNGIRIQKIQISKGLGNQCPWKNSTAMIALQVIKNGQILYSDLLPNLEEYTNNIKSLKKEIKLINKYELNLQFIVDKKVGQIKKIYNTLFQYLPEFIADGISSMKILEIVSYKFSGNIDYFKILNSDLEIINHKGDYEITVCLLNFQESFNLFNKSLQTQEEQVEKIKHLRDLANYYFSQKLLHRSRKINKYLVDEYIKYVNLKDKNKLSHNKEKVIQTAHIDQTDLTPDLKIEFKKSHSNLILILFNLNELKLCNEYIDQFFIIQDKDDEKINFYKFKVLYNLNKFKESKHFLEKLCESKNKQNYEQLLIELNNKLENLKEKKNNFIKKMFKFSEN